MVGRTPIASVAPYPVITENASLVAEIKNRVSVIITPSAALSNTAAA